MGHAVSIYDCADIISPPISNTFNPDSCKHKSPKYGQIRSSSISRSNSNRSLSQLSNTSNISSNSTVSMSDKFVSYNNIIIDIPSSSKIEPHAHLQWKLSIIDKYNAEIMESILSSDENDGNDQYLCIVFGVCDKSLLSLGSKHKYYGFGYSVTYCYGYKFQSFATKFKKTDNITIKYDKIHGTITFYANHIPKKQIIRIDPKCDNVITIKPYDDAHDIEVQTI